jgi:hypothetical protein
MTWLAAAPIDSQWWVLSILRSVNHCSSSSSTCQLKQQQVLALLLLLLLPDGTSSGLGPVVMLAMDVAIGTGNIQRLYMRVFSVHMLQCARHTALRLAAL